MLNPGAIGSALHELQHNTRLQPKRAAAVFRRAVPALLIASVLGFGPAAIAGPSPMYMFINGHVMELSPLKHDVSFKSGCKLCVSGSFTDAEGHSIALKSGDMVTENGVLMKPAANKAHGG